MLHSFVPINEPFLKYHHEYRVDDDDDSIASNERDALDQVLDAMFEPRTWQRADGVNLIQYVSRVPSNRQDAIALQSLLDKSLQKYEAKESGLCPIRRTLIRNEFQMTLQSYKTMYESSVRFGLRFALHNQKRSLDLEIEKEGIVIQQEDLKRRFFELMQLHETTLAKHEETLNSVTVKYQEEVSNLRLTIEKQSKLIDVLNRKPIQL